MRRRLAWLLVPIVAVAAILLRHDVTGLSFVVRAAGMQGVVREVADIGTAQVSERRIAIPSRRGPLGARVYTPSRTPRRAALLVSGLHPAGIDEPRLVGIARHPAGSGLVIVTPDIPELSRFAITPAITDDIEQAGVWLATGSGLAADGRVALMGISFSGGLAIVAAGRPALRDRVAYAFAFGGHDDLPRVLHYLCTGEDPSGTRRFPPHDYGVAVILLGIADRLVPAGQVSPLQDAVRRYLWASHLDRVDRAAAAREFEALRGLPASMPEPSATLLRYVNDRDVGKLGPRLLPYVGEYGGDPALSVSRSPKPSAPVFLLHGTEDNVVPPVESEFLARDLQGSAPTRLLLSSLISHAEADRPMHPGDIARLAGFWGDLLSR